MAAAIRDLNLAQSLTEKRKALPCSGTLSTKQCIAVTISKRAKRGGLAIREAETVLYNFGNLIYNQEGSIPFGGLTNVNGKLHGTTRCGGASGGSGNPGYGTFYTFMP
jgi:hypothetical protein